MYSLQLWNLVVSLYSLKVEIDFLANVNSRSRSPCCCPSVRPSVVCRLSVTFVRPTHAIEIFGIVSMPFDTSASH